MHLKPPLYNTYRHGQRRDVEALSNGRGWGGDGGGAGLYHNQPAYADLRPIGEHDVRNFRVGQNVRNLLAGQAVGKETHKLLSAGPKGRDRVSRFHGRSNKCFGSASGNIFMGRRASR